MQKKKPFMTSITLEAVALIVLTNSDSTGGDAIKRYVNILSLTPKIIFFPRI